MEQRASTQPSGEGYEELYAWLEREFRERIWEGRYRKTQIPLRYRDASVEECDPRVRSYAASLMEGGDGWLLLDGPNGRGKTYSGCAVLNALWRERRCKFRSMQQILDDLKSTFDTTGSYSEVCDSYAEVDVLMVDDFGKEQATEWSLPVVFELFRRREADMRPTIITTNMDAKGLYEHGLRSGDMTLSESILSRFGAMERVTLTGGDRRLK